MSESCYIGKVTYKDSKIHHFPMTERPKIVQDIQDCIAEAIDEIGSIDGYVVLFMNKNEDGLRTYLNFETKGIYDQWQLPYLMYMQFVLRGFR